MRTLVLCMLVYGQFTLASASMGSKVVVEQYKISMNPSLAKEHVVFASKANSKEYVVALLADDKVMKYAVIHKDTYEKFIDTFEKMYFSSRNRQIQSVTCEQRIDFTKVLSNSTRKNYSLCLTNMSLHDQKDFATWYKLAVKQVGFATVP